MQPVTGKEEDPMIIRFVSKEDSLDRFMSRAASRIMNLLAPCEKVLDRFWIVVATVAVIVLAATYYLVVTKLSQ